MPNVDGGWLVAGPPWVALRPWHLVHATTDCIVVAAPAIALEGRVTDERGNGLAGVSISVAERMPAMLLSSASAAVMHAAWSFGFWREVAARTLFGRRRRGA